MHTTRTTWFDWHPLKRLALALGTSALAYLALHFAWALRFSLSAGHWVWPRTYETWPLELASYGTTIAWTATPLLLVALFRPRRVRAWLACALVGAVAAWLLSQAWIVQLGLWRSGAPAMDYSRGLAYLQRFHGALFKHYGWAYPVAECLGLVSPCALLLVGWLGRRERWLAWAWVPALLPLGAHVAGVALTFGVINKGLDHRFVLVMPNLAFGVALVLTLAWIQSRSERKLVFASPDAPRAGSNSGLEPALVAGGVDR